MEEWAVDRAGARPEPAPPGTDGSAQPIPAPRALDVDGIAVVSLGTAAWAAALVAAVALHSRLERDGHLWWVAAAAVGCGLGLLGIAYCVRRRNRLGAVADRPPEV